MTFTPEQWTMIITAGFSGGVGALIATLKFGWSVIRLWAMRKAKTQAEKNQIADLDPKFMLPLAVVAAGALAALLGSGGSIIADARPRDPRPPLPCKCPPDCQGPTCGCGKGCDCRCGALPPAPTPAPRPRISSTDAFAAAPVYAGSGKLPDLFF